MGSHHRKGVKAADHKLMLKAISQHFCTFLVLVASIASAETVTVRSGNGSGSRDDLISFLIGPYSTDFSNPLTAADFSNAQVGPPAFIIARNAFWLAVLASDPSARWIGTNANAGVAQGNTALYAISFRVAAAFNSATLTLHYAVDDGLGGVYVNGTAVCKNLIQNGLTDFTQEHTLSCNDVSPALKVGTNWLYIDASNGGAAAGLLFSATITTTGSGVPSINQGGVVNAASALPGAVAPGSIASVYGSFPMIAASQAPSTSWPASLSGLSMQFGGGVQARLYYASGGQVILQVPWELAGQTLTPLTAMSDGQTSPSQTVSLASFAPGIFSMNAQGTGQGAILSAQYRLVDSSNPTIAGAVIQIYCTGLGAVTNQPTSGSPALSDPLSATIATPSATIGGVQAPVLFSGLAPGTVGLYQINAQIPTGVAIGTAVPVAISIGGATSNTVTISVQPAPPPNPLPSITNLSPSFAQAESGPLTVTISGSGFVPASTVTFNSAPHATTFVSSGQLTMTLTASDLAVAGGFAVVVINPPPGGGSSSPVNFNVSPASMPVPPAPTGLSPGGVVPPGEAVNTLTPKLSWNVSPGATGYVVAIANNSTGAADAANIATTSTISPTLTNGATYVWTVAAYNSSGLGAKATPIYFTVTVPVPPSFTGTWRGSWASTVYIASGSLAASLTQSGTSLTGTVSFGSSMCVTSGTLTGTVSGSSLSASIAAGGGQNILFTATINSSNTSIVGTYTLNGGTCIPGGDRGLFALSK